ncbi:MAG: hypothetical protein ACRDUA_22205, partial [Micromonosporaceae bacterium]
MSTPLVAAQFAAPAYLRTARPELHVVPGATVSDPLAAVSAAVDSATYPVGLADPLVIGDATSAGWISAASLVDGTALPLLLDGPTERWGAAPHAAAALAWKAYTYWLALPAVISLVHANRVPLLDADNVRVRLSYQKPFITVGMRRTAVAVLPDDEFAAEPGIVVVDDRAGLLRMLRETLVDRHLAPLAQATRARVRVGARILSGSLASSIGYALQVAQRTSPDAAGHATADLTAQGRAMLDVLDVPGLIDLEEAPDGAVGIRRHTCC